MPSDPALSPPDVLTDPEFVREQAIPENRPVDQRFNSIFIEHTFNVKWFPRRTKALVVLVPKLITTLHSYDRRQFLADLGAGVTVGIVALPLAIAFAIASGVSPERGLWTAIIAGFLISLLGGSRVQIGGPTGAFVVIVYGIVQRYGVDGLLLATFMAGVILVAMGVCRLGSAIKFIPHPLVTGFTSGIAVIIFSSQVEDFLGLSMGTVPPDFVAKLAAFAQHLDSVNPSALLISGVALAIIVVWPRVSHRIPGPFVALLATTALAQLLHLPIETIGSRLGAISASVPVPSMPHLSFAKVQGLIGPPFTIAILGAVESLLSAVVSDGMTRGKHRSNMELIAQGIANMVTPLFGGIPATGAIARTATNVKNGGRTPVAGIVHALTLLFITLFVGRWAALIPMATLAAILVVVAYHMSEWRTFRSELRSPRSDVAVLVTTFALTVLVDLTVAIGVGMVLALFLFMRRMALVTNTSIMVREEDGVGDEGDDETRIPPRGDIPEGVEVYEIDGPFFFGAAAAFKDTLALIAAKPRVLIIRMRAVPAMDSSGLHALRDVMRRSREDGTIVLLSDVNAQPREALRRSGALNEIGETNVFDRLSDALSRAKELVGATTINYPPT